MLFIKDVKQTENPLLMYLILMRKSVTCNFKLLSYLIKIFISYKPLSNSLLQLIQN